MMRQRSRIAHGFTRREVIVAGTWCMSAAGLASGLLMAAARADQSAGVAGSSRSDMYSTVAALVDRQKVIRWALELTAIYSPTGHEGAIADYLQRELRKLGLLAKLQPIAKGRDNVIGRLEGAGGGYDLMLNGHLDTSAVSNADKRRYKFGSTRSIYADESEEPPPPKAIDDQWLFGHDIANMKGAFAAYLGAVDALIRSGIPLKGAVLISGVAGTDPTLSWTDGNLAPTDDELAIGTRYMLNHGVTADMCVLGEPTSLEVVPAHTGRLRLKLTVSENGRIAPASKVNALLTAFGEWIPNYQQAHRFKTIAPLVFIYGPQCTQDLLAADCSIYLEIRILPGQHPLDIVNEVRALTNALRAVDPALNIVIEPLLVEPASEVESNAPVMEALRKAHQQVIRTAPETTYVKWGADATRLNQSGIPTVIYGPGTMPYRKGYAGAAHGRVHDYQNIEELHTASRVYAVMAADMCSRERI